LQAIDRFVRDCYNAGVWSKLVEVYPFCGDDLTAAMAKLKNFGAAPALTAVNLVTSDYTERGPNGGIAGDGSTKYINSNFALSNLGSTGHFSAYMREAESATPRYWMGAGTATDFYLMGMPTSNPNMFWGGTVQQVTDGSAASVGLYQGERLTTSLMNLYLNGSLRASNSNAVAPGTGAQNVFLLNRNANGVPAQYTPKRFSFFSIGATMTDAERVAFYNAVQNLQVNLGRNV
jgi:hypothetical protein